MCPSEKYRFFLNYYGFQINIIKRPSRLPSLYFSTHKQFLYLLHTLLTKLLDKYTCKLPILSCDPLLLLTFPVIGDHHSHNIQPLATQLPKLHGQFLYIKPPKLSKMLFLHILLAIQPVVAAYQHHLNSSIQCHDVVSFFPFKLPTTTFCLHVTIRSSIFIPPALSPSRLFILLLLAGDINPNPGPPKCLNITYANIRSINKKYPAIAKFISDNDTNIPRQSTSQDGLSPL